MAKNLYTLAEAADELGITIYGARRAADRGSLATEKLGNMRVVSAREIERYRRDRLGTHGPRRKKKG